MSGLFRFSYSSPRRISKLHSPSFGQGDLPEMKSLPSHRYHFFPVRSMSDHYDAANSPLDCYAPSSFASVSRRISFPHNRERYSPLHPGIRHLPPGQIARPQITHHRPPKLPNRRRVIRQVSHCGKPQRTASPKKPLGFSASAKLASGLCPLGSPSKAYSASAHRSPST